MQKFCDKMDLDKKMSQNFNNDCEKKGNNYKPFEHVNYYCVPEH